MGKERKHMIFADDKIILGDEAAEVQIQLDFWNKQMKPQGLKISVEKSEVIMVGRYGELNGVIELEGIPLLSGEPVYVLRWCGEW